MKFKHLIAIYLFGLLLITIGSIFKVMHYSIYSIKGNNLLTYGTVCQSISILYGIFKILKTKKFKAFLNS